MAERCWQPGGLCLLAALALGLATHGHAQPPSACPGAHEVLPVHLYGEWVLEVWEAGDGPAASGNQGQGRLHFERHPEFDGNVRGRVWLRPGAVPALLAGDVSDGELVLDESSDGQRIDAVWVGTPMDCARRFEGHRRPADHRLTDEVLLHFRLHKSPGWR